MTDPESGMTENGATFTLKSLAREVEQDGALPLIRKATNMSKHKSLEERASRIAMVSTGDPLKDQAELLRAAEHQARMEQNICPNGCGPMIFDDPNNRHCPACNFHGWCNVPFAGTENKA